MTTKKAPAKQTAETISVSDIAKELKMDARIARKILRASDLKHEPRSAWVFPVADKQKVVAILKQ